MPSLQPPPEARLIAQKRADLVPRLSRTQAARLTGISEARYRQLEKGVIRVRGQDYQEIAPAETLARMALTVGATPQELRGAGRSDAASILQKLLDAKPDPLALLAEDVRNATGLSERQKEYLLRLLGRDDKALSVRRT